ncbi:32971_t:CDS:2, partial [Gigaspora margarita]
ENQVSESQNQPAISYPSRINLEETFKSYNQSQSIIKRYTDDSDRAIYSGYPISFEYQKNCTAAFIGNKQGINGFITSAQCCFRNNCNLFPNQPSDNVYENEDDGNVTLIGGAYDMMFGNNGLDYVFVTSILNDWDNIPYTTGLTLDDDTISELYLITSYLTLNKTGYEVCAYGAKSGYRCGLLNEINMEITAPNPWNGSLTNLSVNEVYLGIKGFENEDIGGPVYIQIDNSGSTTAQALGHITSIFNDDRTDVTDFYYTPIEKVLLTGIIELATSQQVDAGNTDVTGIKNLEWNDTVNIMDLKIRDDESYYIYAGIIKPNGIKGILTAGHCVFENTDPDVFTEIQGQLQDIGDALKVAVGDKKCFGSVNGYICGKIIAVNQTAEFARSQGLPSYVAKGLNKVDTGSKVFGRGDSGGPVYTSEGLSRAHPAGHGKKDGK